MVASCQRRKLERLQSQLQTQRKTGKLEVERDHELSKSAPSGIISFSKLHHLPTQYHHQRKSGILQLQDAPGCKQDCHKPGNAECPEHCSEAMPAGRLGQQYPNLWGRDVLIQTATPVQGEQTFFFIFPQKKSHKHFNQKTNIFRFSFLDGDPTLHLIALKGLLFPY